MRVVATDVLPAIAVLAAGAWLIRAMTLVVEHNWEFALAAASLAGFMLDAARRITEERGRVT